MSQLTLVNTAWCLEKICESNYQKLLRLIPDLEGFDKTAIGRTEHSPDLHLNVLERNPYTMTIELNHCFRRHSAQHRIVSPGLRIRVYLDAQLAEVIRDDHRPAVDRVYSNAGAAREIRDYKWRLNYFLQKWLDHCLKTEYRFSSAS